MRSPTILMCPPDFYAIEYEINPWMSRSRGSDASRAAAQWTALRDLVLSLGARVELLQPVAGLPDLVFTANAGLVHRRTVYLSRFRHPPRQPETPIDRNWFESQGFEVRETPADASFEGAGDALFCGDTLFAGYIIRSDVHALQWVARDIGCPLIAAQLVDERYYHLDTCFCPLMPGVAVWHPAAFDDYGQAAIRSAVPMLLEVDPEEAARFACNAVVIGRDVILNSGCPQLEMQLGALGFRPHSTPLDEFIKAGGSAKCLTLRLDGEDAAAWTSDGADAENEGA